METISRATIRLLMPNELILFLKKHKALSQYIDEVWKYFNNDLANMYSIKGRMNILEACSSKKDHHFVLFHWGKTTKGEKYWINFYYLYEKESQK